jgi:fructosamine-3-kinase
MNTLDASISAALRGATAVVFDPAPYHGDPETDLAMLELFGGPLPEAFFRGYGPGPPERARRLPLYHLYHALNHLNLFGAGYSSMVRRCLEALRRSAP